MLQIGRTWPGALAAVLVALAAHAGAAGDDAGAPAANPPPFIEEMTIVGVRDRARYLHGAGQVVDRAELRQFAYADVQRIARMIPGVSVQVEDGYGLRPNISIRGVAGERSGRITLLEDNVMIAPAPYSAPAAYYFPTAGRMHAFEVLKGPSTITQGPYTVGGALNMISTPIPTAWGGNVTATAGGDASRRAHVTYGGTGAKGFGLLLETHQWFSDGFQNIDRSDRNAGLRVRDYTLKARYAPPGGRHATMLKLQFADQASNQSYLGLTDADFKADPHRRYGASALDRIDTEHEQAILRYEYSPSSVRHLVITLYRNEHKRDWFKTEGIDFDGSPNAQAFSRVSWFSVVDAANRGAGARGVSSDRLLAILHGADTPPGSIQVRSNDRSYLSQGMQMTLDWEVSFAGLRHRVEAGLRRHEDEEDRLQRNSTYSQRNGALTLDDIGLLGNAGNRIQQARATAFYVRDEIQLGRWTVTPGLRYEDIDQQRVRFETRAGRTSNPASRSAASVRDRRENTTRVWLPGVGATFRANTAWHLFAGVHKGFTAPSNAPGVNEEEALNYELGARFQGARSRFEATAFLSDYDNLLGECTASSGTNCEIGDAFNGDAVTVRGLEAQFEADLAEGRAYRLPLRANLTWIDASFDTDIADTDFFGDVRRGDPVPYLPEWQAQATLGWQWDAFEAYASVSHVDATCVRASCGAFEKTDAALIVDVAGGWAVGRLLTLFARVENLTAAEDIRGRHPYGARPDRARTATLGVQAAF